jgi:hypothetical protein
MVFQINKLRRKNLIILDTDKYNIYLFKRNKKIK